AEQPSVAVFVAERVDQRGQLVDAPVGLPALALERDPLVDDLAHPGRGVALLFLVLVPEQWAETLVLAPVAQGVLMRLELAGLEPLGPGGGAPPGGGAGAAGS